MTVAYLADLGDAVLQAALGGLAEASTGRPPPSHVFLSHGPPALDECCDGGQLSVHLELGYHSSPEDATGATGTLLFAGGTACAIETNVTWTITLARCVPGVGENGYLPTAAALDASAEDLLIDLWAILTELYDRAYAKTLWHGQMECANVLFGEIRPLEPSGGCGGWTVQVTTVCNDSGPLGS